MSATDDTNDDEPEATPDDDTGSESFSVVVRERDGTPTLWEATDGRDGETATGATPGRALRSLGRKLDV